MTAKRNILYDEKEAKVIQDAIDRINEDFDVEKALENYRKRLN